MKPSLKGIPGAFREPAPWKSARGLAHSKTLRDRHPAIAGTKLFLVFFVMLSTALFAAANIDLLQKYPTHLTAGDTDGDKARPWEFSNGDIYRLSKFNLQVAEDLKVEVGPADLAIGHCVDGAVWAVVIPRESGTLTTKALKNSESIAHVWLRFHPAEIARIFPPETVFADGATNLTSQMRRIANLKFGSSWHTGPNAMIPEPKDMTVDVDTKGGLRRFFAVDTAAKTDQYWRDFEKHAVKPPGAITTGEAQAAFDQLWEAFDTKYAMFVLRPEVDWAKLRDEYRPKAIASKDSMEFAGVCAEMLKPLRDLHVWLTVAGEYVPIFNRPRTANSNPDAHQKILGSLHEEQHGVVWAVTKDKIGFIAIYGWNDPAVPNECQTVLENMRDTRGLIVDVRLNGGGSEDQAMEFARRFLTKEFVYAYSRFRNGEAHTNLTEKFERKIAPRGPWRYDRPVVLLIGQKCMSSTESFIGMMTGDQDLVTMGDHTCGSSGNPDMINLPLQMTVSVPQWIDHLPDGTVLDERGFTPQVPFVATAGAFEGERDDLLSAALERLRKSPLRDKPIAGPIFLPADQAEAQDESRPKVISVSPENGAQSVDAETTLRVRFDRPMDPLSLKLDWKSGGLADCEFPQYDPEKYEFTIPVRLAPGASHRVVVNAPMAHAWDLSEDRANFPRNGFISSENRLARMFAWTFQTKSAQSSQGTPPKVVKVTPAPGSEVPYRTFLEVQFDQSMKAPPEALPYLNQSDSVKRARMICHVDYDDATHTFRIPLLLPPKEKSAFTVTGFVGATGLAAEPVKVEYQVSGEEMSAADRKKFDESAKNPSLLKALHSIKQIRDGVTSVAERIQTLMLFRDGRLFTRLLAQSASFKWQQPNLYFADVSDIMMTEAFKIGTDGKNWWHQSESKDATNFVVCPVGEMQKLNVSICDPFNLMQEMPEQAAARLNLTYLGVMTASGSKCWAFEGWSLQRLPDLGTYGSLTRWHVNEQSGRVLEITQFFDNVEVRDRFLYDAVNESLTAENFAVPKIAGLSPAPPDSLDQDYTVRFVTLRDGSDGKMSLWWGKEGPKGRSGDGLN